MEFFCLARRLGLDYQTMDVQEFLQDLHLNQGE